MGKSKKKHPFAKFCGKSDKRDKKVTNRKFRRFNKHRLVGISEDLDNLLHRTREAMDVWSWSSDGTKKYRGNSPLATSQDPEDKELWRKWMKK